MARHENSWKIICLVADKNNCSVVLCSRGEFNCRYVMSFAGSNYPVDYLSVVKTGFMLGQS